MTIADERGNPMVIPCATMLMEAIWREQEAKAKKAPKCPMGSLLKPLEDQVRRSGATLSVGSRSLGTQKSAPTACDRR